MELHFIVISAYIDTRSAGFGSVPHYMARIAGPREFSGQYVDALVFISEQTAAGFTVSASLIPDSVKAVMDDPQRPALLNQIMDAWSVVWMGIEG